MKRRLALRSDKNFTRKKKNKKKEEKEKKKNDGETENVKIIDGN